MVATNVKDFAVKLNKYALGLPEEKLSQVVRKVSLQALARIVLRTPVDTGRARGNWQVTIDGTPAKGTVQALDKDGTRTVVAGGKEIAQAKPFGVVYITNNLPYIEPLENGHSKQAPPGGIVRITAQEMQAVFE